MLHHLLHRCLPPLSVVFVLAGAALPATAQQPPLPREWAQADPAPGATSYREINLSFTHDTLTLRGRLVLPPSGKRHPMVVLMGGSDSWSYYKGYFRALVDEFVPAGIGVFYYDKRSEGTPLAEKSSFDDLAGDALAAVDMLRRRADVDSMAVGLWGHSQGGWIAPLAASRSSHVRFVITAGGPGVGPFEQTMYSQRNGERRRGLSEDEVDAADRLRRVLALYYSHPTQQGWKDANAALATARRQPWFSKAQFQELRGVEDSLGTPEQLAELNRTHPEVLQLYTEQMPYDPVPALKAIRVPLLAIYGGADQIVPVDRSIAAFRGAFDSSGHRSLLTVHVFPGANHGIMMSSNGLDFAPGYLDTMRAWLRGVVQVISSSSGPPTHTAPPPFLKTFGGTGVDVGNRILRLDDGGYAVVGYTSSFGAGGEDVYLIRTDAHGDTLWTRTYGGSGDDDGWDLARRPGGGFVIAGFGNSWGAGGDDVLMLATDAGGRLQWKRTYGGPEGERSWGMAAMPGGGWVVVGQTRSRGAGDWDAYVIRTDEAGDSVWTRVFGGPGIDRALNVAVTPAGDIAVTGFTTAAPDADRDGFVALLSPRGAVLWNRTLRGDRDEVGHGVVTDPDGTILVTGYGDSWGAGDNDVVLWRLDSSGTVLSRHRVGSVGVDDRAMMTALDPDGTQVVLGYVHGGDGDWDMSLWHATRNGDVLGQQVFSHAGDDRGVFALWDGGDSVVITGARASGPGAAPDVLLARVKVLEGGAQS